MGPSVSCPVDTGQVVADDIPGVKFNLPTLTKSMGFTSTKAQLLSVPPYILASITCVLIPHLSDRYGARAACKSTDCRLRYVSGHPLHEKHAKNKNSQS